MNELYLNPFIFIAKQKDQYFINAGINSTILLTDSQAELLMSSDSFHENTLEDNFTPKEIDMLINTGCLLPFQFNLAERNSRTRGYFHELGMLEQYEILCDKHIFLLGAGALGTHLGWGLCTLGITRFTILDYDIIEPSNLNRQLLYTFEDIGQLKTEALKRHLLELNPICEITIINRRISCKEDLFEVIPKDSALVVRGIDTPAEISEWVFSACEALGKPYISGGTIGTNTLLGPCYVPDITPGFSSVTLNGIPMFGNNHTARRLRGTGVSSCFSVTHVASELLLEAVKILTGQGLNLKYGGRIELQNPLQNVPPTANPDTSPAVTVQKEKPEKEKPLLLLYLLFTLITMTVVTVFSPGNTLFLMYEYLMLTAIGFTLWRNSPILMYTNALIGGSLTGSINLTVTLIEGRFTPLMGNTLLEHMSVVPSVIFLYTLMICLHSMLFIALEGFAMWLAGFYTRSAYQLQRRFKDKDIVFTGKS